MDLIFESTHIFYETPKEMCSFVDLGADKIIIIKGTKCSQSQLYVLCAMRCNS
jgi:hypothetical protein